MPDSSISLDEDFSAQLQALVEQAEKKPERTSKRAARPPQPVAEPAEVETEEVEVETDVMETGEPVRPTTKPDAAGAQVETILEMLTWVAAGVEKLKSRQEESARSVERIEEAVSGADALPKIVLEARQAIEHRNFVNKAMFEALHTELKGYKDSFLLESVLKPVVRDLISLYDSTCELGRQMAAAVNGSTDRSNENGKREELHEAVQTMSDNVGHHAHFVLEVLERMGVTLLPSEAGFLNKQTQRAVSLEVAEGEGEDQLVVKVLKRGFVWRDRAIRPEEVVIKKWSRSPAPPPNSVDPK